MFTSIPCVDFTMHNTFKVYCCVKFHQVMFWCMLPALKVFCMEKFAQNLDGHLTFQVFCMMMQRTLKVIYCTPVIKFYTCKLVSNIAASQSLDISKCLALLFLWIFLVCGFFPLEIISHILLYRHDCLLKMIQLFSLS